MRLNCQVFENPTFRLNMSMHTKISAGGLRREWLNGWRNYCGIQVRSDSVPLKMLYLVLPSSGNSLPGKGKILDSLLLEFTAK